MQAVPQLCLVDEGCSGYAGQAATVAVEVGSALWREEIIIEATSDTDAVMAILLPMAVCSATMAPRAQPPDYSPAQRLVWYKIWVGSLIEGETFEANVTVGTNMGFIPLVLISS